MTHHEWETCGAPLQGVLQAGEFLGEAGRVMEQKSWRASEGRGAAAGSASPPWTGNGVGLREHWEAVFGVLLPVVGCLQLLLETGYWTRQHVKFNPEWSCFSVTIQVYTWCVIWGTLMIYPLCSFSKQSSFQSKDRQSKDSKYSLARTDLSLVIFREVVSSCHFMAPVFKLLSGQQKV